mmetsp:Transcript_10310/g.22425  ORF Transcript_10310/g.22425 Transcript_10310/m.22425 type:complete len:290 (+) Transcript_10310:671-1540(+)
MLHLFEIVRSILFTCRHERRLEGALASESLGHSRPALVTESGCDGRSEHREARDLTEIQARNHLLKSLPPRGLCGSVETRVHLIHVLAHVQVTPLCIDDHLVARCTLPFGHRRAFLYVRAVCARAKDNAERRSVLLVCCSLHRADRIIGERLHGEANTTIVELLLQQRHHLFALDIRRTESLIPEEEIALIECCLLHREREGEPHLARWVTTALCCEEMRNRVGEKAEKRLARTRFDVLRNVILSLRGLANDPVALERDTQHAEVGAAQVEGKKIAALISGHPLIHKCW